MYINKKRKKGKNVIKETINNPFLYSNFCKSQYMLGGKNTKEYVETQVRNYDNLKTKTTRSLLPDSESRKQHIQKENLQCYQ